MCIHVYTYMYNNLRGQSQKCHPLPLTWAISLAWSSPMTRLLDLYSRYTNPPSSVCFYSYALKDIIYSFSCITMLLLLMCYPLSPLSQTYDDNCLASYPVFYVGALDWIQVFISKIQTLTSFSLHSFSLSFLYTSCSTYMLTLNSHWGSKVGWPRIHYVCMNILHKPTFQYMLLFSCTMCWRNKYICKSNYNIVTYIPRWKDHSFMRLMEKKEKLPLHIFPFLFSSQYKIYNSQWQGFIIFLPAVLKLSLTF